MKYHYVTISDKMPRFVNVTATNPDEACQRATKLYGQSDIKACWLRNNATLKRLGFHVPGEE